MELPFACLFVFCASLVSARPMLLFEMHQKVSFTSVNSL